jgi:hypothetical protein
MPTASTRHRAGTLNTPTCWAHLGSARIGRLMFQTGRGPRSVMVTFVPSSDGLSSGVLLRLPAYNIAAGYVPEREVTFEVEGSDPDNWTVRLTGVARPLTETQARAVRLGVSPELGLEQWPDDVPSRYVYIPASTLSGSRSAPTT